MGIISFIGGSGFYDLKGFEVLAEEVLDTPFGQPSDAIVRGKLSGEAVLFLPRHGKKHHLLPSEVNYQANIYALKQLGAKWCIGIGAAGSLNETIRPGDLVLADQFLDFTRQRKRTFFGEGIVGYASLADPFCSTLRETLATLLMESAAESEYTAHSSGTYLCIEGPALSTRAESHLYRQFGADVIGMTLCPEVMLAREAELAYASIAMISDYDCWNQDAEDVNVPNALAVLKKSGQFIHELIPRIVEGLRGQTPSAVVSDALKTTLLTDPGEIAESVRCRLPSLAAKKPVT